MKSRNFHSPANQNGQQFQQVTNSRPEVFCKKDARKNFAKFTGKHLCQSFFLNKVTVGHSCFPVNFEKFLRTRTPPVAASDNFLSPFTTEKLLKALKYTKILYFSD